MAEGEPPYKHFRHSVICDEFNSDMPERSFNFEPDGRIGAFRIPLTKQVQEELVKAL